MLLIGVSGLIFFFSLLFFTWIFNVLFVREQYIERLDNLDPTKKLVEEKKVKKQNRTVFFNIAQKLPKRKNSKMAAKLIKANILISSEELLIYRLLFSSVLGFSAYSLRPDIIIVLLVVAFVWYLPHMWLNSRIKSRASDFNEQLNGGLVLISNALKAGHSFIQAVSIAAKETQGTFSEEFKVLLKELNFGLPMEQAFKNMLNRVESSDMQLVVNAILIQKDIGGNLSEILENISTTIRERQKLKNEMKTLTAQGRMSGAIVMLIPVALGLFFYVFNKPYIMVLFQTQVGIIMMTIGIVNEIIGFFIIRKIVSIDF